MTRNDIENQVQTFLVDELEIDPGKIRTDSRLKEDMGIDSLEVVDVVVFVDECFGFKMKPEDFRELKTFGAFCDFIQQRLGA